MFLGLTSIIKKDDVNENVFNLALPLYFALISCV